jgi:hypothetical protein
MSLKARSQCVWGNTCVRHEAVLFCRMRFSQHICRISERQKWRSQTVARGRRLCETVNSQSTRNNSRGLQVGNHCFRWMHLFRYKCLATQELHIACSVIWRSCHGESCWDLGPCVAGNAPALRNCDVCFCYCWLDKWSCVTGCMDQIRTLAVDCHSHGHIFPFLVEPAVSSSC